jgi:hypothetical protein
VGEVWRKFVEFECKFVGYVCKTVGIEGRSMEVSGSLIKLSRILMKSERSIITLPSNYLEFAAICQQPNGSLNKEIASNSLGA